MNSKQFKIVFVIIVIILAITLIGMVRASDYEHFLQMMSALLK